MPERSKAEACFSAAPNPVGRRQAEQGFSITGAGSRGLPLVVAVRKSSGWEQGGAWGWPVGWGDRDTAQSRECRAGSIKSSCPRPRARVHLLSWARGVSSVFLLSSVSCSSQVIHNSNPSDITRYQPYSSHSNPVSAAKFTPLHLPWHHLVYNLGPGILTNLEVRLATK